MTDYEKALEEQLLADNAAMRKAGCDMAMAALHVIANYDGVHRLSLAVSEWTRVVAEEGGRARQAARLKESEHG